MEFLANAQALLSQNIYMIGIGLLVAVLLAGVAWYSMSRSSSSSGSKNSVLVNQARIDEATTDVPSSASEAEPIMPPPQKQEDVERLLASMGAESSDSN